MTVVFPLWYADAGGANVGMSVLMILVCCVMLIERKLQLMTRSIKDKTAYSAVSVWT